LFCFEELNPKDKNLLDINKLDNSAIDAKIRINVRNIVKTIDSDKVAACITTNFEPKDF